MKDETLYVNLTDEQCRRLNDIEQAVWAALVHKCKKADVLDTVRAILAKS